MIHEIRLPNRDIRLIPLDGSHCQAVLPDCTERHVALHGGCCNRFAVVVKGFVQPLVLEISETAIAQLHGDVFDLDVSLGLSDLISHAVAEAEAVIGSRKSVRMHDLVFAGDDMNLSAVKGIEAAVNAVAEDALRSFAYSIDAEELDSVCVAKSELGSIRLMRLRLLDDDADYRMTDDMDLTLSEIYRFEETG